MRAGIPLKPWGLFRHLTVTPIDNLYDTMRPAILIICSVLLGTPLSVSSQQPITQANKPERIVANNTLRSDRDPAILLQIKQPVQYVGGDRWVLYGVADCEVHVFVEADSAKNVTRLYWIQFEGYLPESRGRYDSYKSPIRADIGGREFIVDGGLMRTQTVSRPGSDRERVFEILKAKGYVLPPGMMYRRMVHLPTPDLRKELMIIYAEDLAPTGHAVDDLVQGGKSVAVWPQLAEALLQRAVERISAR